MAKALSLRKDRTKGTQRTRKLSTGNVRGMLRKWEGTLREASLGEWTEGAEPCKVKALSTVLNGGREETCRKVTRLAPTHQGVGNRACSPWLTRDSRALFPPVTCTALALSPLQDPSGLDAGLLGRPDGAGRH